MPFDVRNLSRFQADFLDRVTSPDASGTLRIFHDTWFHGLLDGLRDSFPATIQALGEPAFNAFARDFIRSHPLGCGDQTFYGADFPAFLESHPQAVSLAWLGDLARLEWAEHHAHHAADAVPCDFKDLLDPDLRLAVHPSVRQVHLAWNVEALREEGMAFALKPQDRHWLIGRDRDDDVVRLCLTPLETAFLAALIETGLLTAVLTRFSADTLSQLQASLARLVQAGFLIQFGN